MRVDLELLGSYRVEVGGRPLPRLPDRPMRAALLAYLAVEREVARDRAIADFQKRGEAPEKTRHRLNQTLHVLRSDLEGAGADPSWVSSRGPVIGVSDDVTTDVQAFESAVAQGDDEEALRRYGGDFLVARDLLQDAPNFEPWVSRIRDRLRRLHHEASARIIEERLAAGDLERGIEVARQWVRLDPLDDRGHDQLIRLLADAGRRHEALQQYLTYEETVWRAFGDAPWKSTQALIESLDARPASAEELRRRDRAEFQARGPKPDSVLVSWFECDGADEELENRAGGVVRRVRDALAAVELLQVEPITATLYAKEHPGEATAIAEALNVAWVVEGRLTPTDSRLELAVRLVRSRDAKSWSAAYGLEENEGEFRVHRDVAHWASSTILSAIEGEDESARKERRARDARALSLLDVALSGYEARSEPGFHVAVEKLEEALEIAPNLARAHSTLADVLIAQAQFGFRRPEDVMPRAIDAANQALAIDPDLADAFAARGHYLDTYEWDWASAEADYLEAIRLNPEIFNARTWYSDMLTAVGRFRDARDQISHAEGSHPLSAAVHWSKGTQHYRARRFPQAIESLDRALELKPRYLIALVIRSFARIALEQGDTAVAEMEQVRAMVPTPNPLIELSLGAALASVGDEAGAGRCLATIEAVGQQVWVPAVVRAIMRCYMGQADAAVADIEVAMDERWGQLIYLAVDPSFDPVREHPRYPEFLGRLGLG